MKSFLLRASLFLLLFGLVAEVCFRWGLPARETPLVRQEPVSRLIQFDPAGPRDGVFSSGRWAQQRARWHVNAQGWNNLIDLQSDTDRERPAVVITGDSQIEGFYIDPEAHLIRRLASRAQEKVVGYSLAVSGYKLGEYIEVARYLHREAINPAVFIIFINPGDFWRGVTNLDGRAGVVPRVQINSDGAGEVTASGTLPISRWRRTLRHSATLRYLLFNANLNPFAKGPADLALNAAAQDPEADAETNPVYDQAFRFVVTAVQEALPRSKVLVLVDADRRGIMSGEHPDPIPTSGVVASVCADLGCAHVDMTGPFTKAWRADGQRLHFEHNVHWNAHAHDLASAAVFEELRRRDWLSAAP